MANKDFVVKNGLVTGANNATFGTAVTLASNGNVGIGTASPGAKFQVTSAGNMNNGGVLDMNAAAIVIGTTTTGIGFDANQMEGSNTPININYVSNTDVTVCFGGGNVGIGIATPTNKLAVNGSITATANVSAASVNASTGFYGTVQTATQGTINHNSLANYVADQHVAHSTISITAGTGLSGGGTINASRTLNVTNVPNAVTFNNGGAGSASGNTFNGSSAITVSYNTIGAPSTTGTNASGTWSININGSAASATNASAATNATYATSAGSATNAAYATSAGSATNASAATNATNASNLGGVAASSYVRNDLSSRQTGGVTRLFRNDATDNYSVQTYWTGSRWRLYGYLNDTGHADTHAGFADAATNASAATNATYATSAGSATNATYATSAGTANTTQILTFASNGTGNTSGNTFNGGTAKTISYNSIGAPSTTGNNASGTWSISINGSAASATNASAAANATYATSAGSATNATYATSAGSATNATYATTSGATTESGSWTLLNTLTASNSPSLSDTTSLTSTYDWYDIVFQNIYPVTNSTTLYLQVYSGAAFQTSNYYYVNWLYNAGGNATYASSVASGIPLGQIGYMANTLSGHSGFIRVFRPSVAGIYKPFIGKIQGPNSAASHGGGEINGFWNGGTGAITGFQFLAASGNLSSGIIKIYGVTA